MSSGKLKVSATTVATVAAVAAILLGVWDSVQTRRHNRLSVAPYLVVDYTISASPTTSTYSIALTNEGVGPAIIRSLHITLPSSLGGGSFTEWGEVVKRLRERGFEVPSYWNFEGGEALGVQKDRQLIAATLTRDDNDRALQAAVSEIQVVVKYASVYGIEYESSLLR